MTLPPRQELRLNGRAHSRLRAGCLPAGPCPPHRWGCPVVMKVDPRSVAWTCGSCGAIATVPVGAPPPSPSPAI